MQERRFTKRRRYPGHDYRAPCSVHVTICTWNRQHLCGEITAAGVSLNDPGRFVEASLLGLHAPDRGIEIDTHVVMPDHLHAIIHLGTHPTMIPDESVSDVVRRFKMRILRAWPGGVRHRGWLPYDTHLWQESFHDTLIRNDAHLEVTRRYIIGNPGRWIERYGPDREEADGRR